MTILPISPTTLEMSYEQFLDWSTENVRAEWVNGKATVYMPPKLYHQEIIEFLGQLFSLYIRLFDLGKIILAPFEMRLFNSSREPDIMFVAQNNLRRLTNDRLDGPADLVVEVVSSSTMNVDRGAKLYEYATAGVGEYWLVDSRPGKRRADFYRLAESGRYELYADEDLEWVDSAIIPGFKLKPEWLWQAATLSPLFCFLGIEGVEEELHRQRGRPI